MKPEELIKKPEPKKMTRHDYGEAWMMCQDCGARLFWFDGDKDECRPCPYKNGCKQK